MEKTKFSLKELRARNNMTQQDVADQLGVTVITYGKMERDPKSVKILRMMEIAKLLGVTLDDISL